MPRVTVYIPDRLYDEAKAIDPSKGFSRMVQEGLRLTIDQAKKGGPSVVSSELKEKLEAAKARHVASASVSYRRGYEAGLSLAGELEWGTLDAIVGMSGHMEMRLKAAAEHLEDKAAWRWWASLQEQPWVTTTWESGILQALEDIRDAVLEDAPTDRDQPGRGSTANPETGHQGSP